MPAGTGEDDEGSKKVRTRGCTVRIDASTANARSNTERVRIAVPSPRFAGRRGLGFCLPALERPVGTMCTTMLDHLTVRLGNPAAQPPGADRHFTASLSGNPVVATGPSRSPNGGPRLGINPTMTTTTSPRRFSAVVRRQRSPRRDDQLVGGS